MRRGGSTAGLLGVLALVGGLAATAVVFRPRELGAAPTSTEGPQPSPDQQLILDSLSSIVGGSHAVIAVHRRGPTPFEEVVLWLHDGQNRGVVDPAEIGLLSHSPMMQSITFRGVDADGPVALAAPPDTIDFCAWWRGRRDVRRRVVATGISDMQVRRTSDESSSLRISLTWSPSSTDHPQQATVLVDIAAPEVAAEE